MSLTVKDLTKRYGDRTVVDRLSFGMPGPGVYALLGTNGAGKTTSIRMMLNMLSRDGGEVLWNGEPLDISRCNVGYLAEERGLYPKYALMDQLLYFASLRDVPRAEARRRIRYWAQRLEVEEYLYPSAPAQAGRRGLLGGSAQREKPKRPDQLSKGNQQKIQLMAALLSDPELLILDEPLSGLDPINTDLFKGIIREEIEAGKYLIMSSHQMATVEEFCTDLTILDRSRTVLQGHLNDIKKGYGRVHLQLKTEEDAGPYIAESGAQIVTRKEFEYQLKVTGQEQANDLLAMLAGLGVSCGLTAGLMGPGVLQKQLSGLLAAVPRVQEDLWQAAGVLLVLLVSLGLGYLTMSLIGGVAGACCSGMEEAGEATGPVMLLTMAGYLASFVVGAVPSGPVAVFSTLCPVVSIFCAPVQFAGGNVSFWLVLASWAIQAAVIWGLLTLASRVYAGLIVHRGSRVKLRELMSMAKGGAVR